MGHTLNNQKSLLTRVRRIKGQAATALEAGQEYLKIFQQVAVVRGAVNGQMSELLGGHIRERLMDEKASEQEGKEDLDVIVAVIRSYMN